MRGSLTADLLKLRKRAATWLIGGGLIATIAIFGYLLPFLFYSILLSSPELNTGEFFENPALPEAVIRNLLANTGGLGSWLALALGAMSVGSEYRWGTATTVLLQRATRLEVLAGKLGALAVVLAIFSIVGLLVSVGLSLILAWGEPGWPGILELAGALGTAWLMLATWCAFGVLLAIVVRGGALAIVLGIGYAILIEIPVTLITALFEPVRGIAGLLLGANTFTLAVTPLIVPEELAEIVVRPVASVIIVAAYLAAFLVLAGWIVARRDRP